MYSTVVLMHLLAFHSCVCTCVYVCTVTYMYMFMNMFSVSGIFDGLQIFVKIWQSSYFGCPRLCIRVYVYLCICTCMYMLSVFRILEEFQNLVMFPGCDICWIWYSYTYLIVWSSCVFSFKQTYIYMCIYVDIHV